MDTFKNLIAVSSKSTNIQYPNDIHKMIGCTKKDCDILIVLKPLQKVLFNPQKDYKDQRELFVKNCIQYPNFFICMFQLKSKKANVNIVVEKLYRKDRSRLRLLGYLKRKRTLKIKLNNF